MVRWFTDAGCRDAVRWLATAGISYLSGFGKTGPGNWRELAVSMVLWGTFFRAALTE